MDAIDHLKRLLRAGDPHHEYDGSLIECTFCRKRSYTATHKDDCPWVAAEHFIRSLSFGPPPPAPPLPSSD
jgi:hypothetical protein